eukprot:4339344-Pyramimonas_sp.AAC.1
MQQVVGHNSTRRGARVQARASRRGRCATSASSMIAPCGIGKWRWQRRRRLRAWSLIAGAARHQKRRLAHEPAADMGPRGGHRTLGHGGTIERRVADVGDVADGGDNADPVSQPVSAGLDVGVDGQDPGPKQQRGQGCCADGVHVHRVAVLADSGRAGPRLRGIVAPAEAAARP